ncbi:MAG: class II aldolase/adducin family protein [Pseudonocardia sp.]
MTSTSSVSYERWQCRELPGGLVSIADGTVLDGHPVPSSEWRLHTATYRSRPDVKCGRAPADFHAAHRCPVAARASPPSFLAAVMGGTATDP